MNITWLDASLLQYIVCIAAAYLIGNIPTGDMIGRHTGHDVRKEGSKNVGATNVMRTAGVKWGLITFAGDFLKAYIAVLIPRLWVGQYSYCALLCGLAVVVGHNWPVFFGFRGGKGISCTAGAACCIFLWQGALCCALFLAVMFTTKLVSLSSLALVTLFFILITVTVGFIPAGLWALVLAALAFLRHRENIKRLLNGTENRIGRKKPE